MNNRKIKHRLKYKAAAVILGLTMMITGCGSNEEATTTGEATTQAGTTQPTTSASAGLSVAESSLIHDPTGITLKKDGMILNPLTGLWIDEKYENLRPISAQYCNVPQALPSYGLSFADIIYEMVTEARTTRLMPIFTEYDKVEKFEALRSTRHYFNRKTVEYDTIHLFCGASDYANHYDLYWQHYPYLEFVDLIKDPGLNRDNSRVAPYNAFTYPDQVLKQMEAKGYSKTHRSYYECNHKFASEFTDLADGDTATKVSVPYFRKNLPWFEYNEAEQVYYRYQFEGKHVDGQTGEQLKVTNILIQYVPHRALAGYEEAGSQDIDWTGSGEGVYCTGGKRINVTWRYNNYSTRWYDASGEEIKMNPGKTWIVVSPKTYGDGYKGVLFNGEEQ
ncbi:MAG: DUF3048 domain-containing protein [Eubacterium sp.]|nr:DUF3048 domain-containing protein [Eubacterium sp.]